MPNLKHLDIKLLAYTRGINIDLGIQHLASLTKVEILVDAWRNNRGGVQALEAETRRFLDAHPNRPTLTFNSFFTKHNLFRRRWEQWIIILIVPPKSQELKDSKVINCS